MNLPNLLTLSRLLAIPALMALLVMRFRNHDQYAALLFVAASLTDTMDGQLARRWGKVTELGKFLDPLADKLFILSVLIVLVQERELAAWIVVVIFSRELLITILRSLSASQGRVISATPFGKTKTVTQVGAVLLLILQRPYPAIHWPAQIGIWVAVALTVWSGFDYMWRFRHVFTRGQPGPAPLMATPAGGAPGGESPVGPLSREVGERLEALGLTLSLAESCTGGMVAAAITDRPGSSRYFQGGLVAYADQLKREQLGVADDVLSEHGAVSRECAKAMAEGARRRFGTDYAVSVTGIAGPEAGGSEKPAGLTFIGVAGPRAVKVFEFQFSGDRWANRRQAVEEALHLLLQEVPWPETAHLD